jgi:hypothetical protein
MPYKNRADKLKYMADYYLKNRDAKRVQIKQSKKGAFVRDPEGTRKKWATYRANARNRAALRELEAVRQAAKQSKPTGGYTGTLKPNHF